MTEQLTAATSDRAAGGLTTTTKTMTVSEAKKAAEGAAHTGLVSWINQPRDELEQELDVFTTKLDDWFFEKHFNWAIEAALEKLAPCTIVPDPEEPEEDY
jgi:hypothetical protein